MKLSSLMLAILLIAADHALSQEAPPARKMTYKITISDSASESLKGYLYDITDSSLKISQWAVALRAAEVRDAFKEVDHRQIRDVTIKRNHAAGRGAWKGALIGTLVGVIAGLVEGGDPQEYWFRLSAGDKALIYGGMAGTVGTGVGALVGALVKKKYTIAGRKKKFDEMKINVLNKAYGNTLKMQQ
jgi:hypothetical protein